MTVLMMIGMPSALLGQGDRLYQGPWRMGAYGGDAEFGYRLQGQDTVLDGAFRLQKANLPGLLSATDRFYAFEGAFDGGVPTGPWRFAFGQYAVSEGTEVIDYHYKVKVSGLQHETVGQLSGGKPQGKWTQATRRVKGSQVSATMFSSTLYFDQGVPQQGLQVEDRGATLMGRFLRGGLAHDVWELFPAQGADPGERWHFVEGRLAKIELADAGQQAELPIYPTPFAQAKTIHMDARYLSIVRLARRLGGTANAAPGAGFARLLTQNDAHYRRVDSLFAATGWPGFMPTLKVRVPHYPLTGAELGQRAAIEQYYQSALAMADTLLADSHLNVLKLTDPEALFLLSAANGLRDNHLALLGTMLAYWEDGVLAYVPRAALLGKLWPEGAPTTAVPVRFEGAGGMVDTTYTGPNAASAQLGKAGIAGFYQLAEYAHGTMGAIKATLDEKLANKRRQQALAALEEELVAAAGHLDGLVDSLRYEIFGPPNTTLVSIKAASKRELGHYSATEGDDTTPEELRALVGCLWQMGDLALAVAKLPSQWEEIKKAYTDKVWNPFTATVMSEEVKKRITDAYQKVLVPYLLETAEARLSCDNTPQLAALLGRVHQRVLEMRNEDTAKVERKLRKAQGAQAVMALFDIDQTQNNIEQ